MQSIFLLTFSATVSLVTFVLFFWDKRCAMKQKWRIPERHFFIMSLFGGGIGLLLGMKIFRHKTKKFKFWLIGYSTTFLWLGASVYLLFI